MARMYTTPPKFSAIPNAIREDVPVFILDGDCQFDDTLFLAGAILETVPDFTPNTSMFPLNKKAYELMVSFLKDYDEKGMEWSKEVKMAYIKKLPEFEGKWKQMNDLAQKRRMSLVMAVKATQAPILGAPPKAPTVTEVDMTQIPQLPYEENTVVGKGNTLDKDMSSVAAVQKSVA